MLEKNINLSNNMINTYYDELKEDLTITIANIRERAFLVSSTRSKWLMYLFKEKENLNKVKTKKKEIVASKLATSSSTTNNSLLRLKDEDKLENSDVIKKLNTLARQCQEVVDFLEYVLSIMNDYGFTIKNTIDLLKLEQM